MFDDEDFEDEELERERNEEEERVENLPIVKKAEDLFTTVMAFLESVDDEEDDIDLKPRIFEDIAIINAKIRGAESGDLFFIRMENAVLVKVHAVSIQNIMFTYELMGIGDPDYLRLITNEIEDFRKVFVDWVATFERNDDFLDDWGLFN